VKDKKMKKIIRFTASWCQPCKMLASIIEEIDTNIPIEVVDIDVHPDVAIEFGIRGVPTLVKIDENGNVIGRLVGLNTKNLIEEFIND
jgi:thioredoxin 1